MYEYVVFIHRETSLKIRLPSRSWDRTGLIMLLDLFLVRFFCNFSVCPDVWWTKLFTAR